MHTFSGPHRKFRKKQKLIWSIKQIYRRIGLQVERSFPKLIDAIDIFHGPGVLAARASRGILSPISPSRNVPTMTKGEA